MAYGHGVGLDRRQPVNPAVGQAAGVWTVAATREKSRRLAERRTL